MTIRALVLLIDTAHRGEGDDETSVAARYETALASLIPLDEIAAVRTYLPTEHLPDAYAGQSKYALTA